MCRKKKDLKRMNLYNWIFIFPITQTLHNIFRYIGLKKMCPTGKFSVLPFLYDVVYYALLFSPFTVYLQPLFLYYPK